MVGQQPRHVGGSVIAPSRRRRRFAWKIAIWRIAGRGPFDDRRQICWAGAGVLLAIALGVADVYNG